MFNTQPQVSILSFKYTLQTLNSNSKVNFRPQFQIPTSHIRFRVNIKFQLQKSALNISSKLQIQTSMSTAKVIFKVNFKLSCKNSTKSNFNFKVKLYFKVKL